MLWGLHEKDPLHVVLLTPFSRSAAVVASTIRTVLAKTIDDVGFPRSSCCSTPSSASILASKLPLVWMYVSLSRATKLCSLRK